MIRERECITPVAACALFGKSAEAVRRAVAEGLVTTSCELNFGANPIRLLDLDSAITYWHRSGQPSLRPIEHDLNLMRFYGVVVHSYVERNGELEADPLSRVRILHHAPLLSYSVLGKEPPKDLAFDDA